MPIEQAIPIKIILLDPEAISDLSLTPEICDLIRTLERENDKLARVNVAIGRDNDCLRLGQGRFTWDVEYGKEEERDLEEKESDEGRDGIVAVYDLLVTLVGVNEGLKKQNDGLRAANAELVAQLVVKLELKAKIAKEGVNNRAEFMRRMAANCVVATVECEKRAKILGENEKRHWRRIIRQWNLGHKERLWVSDMLYWHMFKPKVVSRNKWLDQLLYHYRRCSDVDPDATGVVETAKQLGKRIRMNYLGAWAADLGPPSGGV